MFTTKTVLKKEVQDELKCPSEYIRHLSHFDVFGELKDAVLSDEKCTVEDIMKDIRDGYNDYCTYAGLDASVDNRKTRVGFFIY